MSFPLFKNGLNILCSALKTEGTSRTHLISYSVRHFSQAHDVAINDRALSVTNENQFEALAEAMEPLCSIPYEEQLEWKQNQSHQILEKLIQRFKTLKFKGNIRNCAVEKISPSPVLNHYRNKDEFSIHYGIDGNPKTVGFFVGRLSKNIVSVPGTHLSIIKEEHKVLAEVYQNFILSSDLPVCYTLDDGGCFRNFIVRSNSVGETMAIAVSHPGGRTPFEIEKEREHLVEFFEKSGVMPTSLFHQTCKNFRCTNAQSPIKLLHGEPYLTEKILDLDFRISPDAFFQINVKAAEVLYQEILHLAQLKRSTTLLDLCCGTGTISIIAAKRTRGCIGIEAVKDAVGDARINAVNNNIYNCEFVHGTVKAKLFYALQDLDMASHLVTVINPGRAGLHDNVMEMILKCDLIRQLIYVSCSANNPVTMRNFVHLTRDNPKAKHYPFVLTKIKPVDLFPQTRHCEHLLVFKR